MSDPETQEDVFNNDLDPLEAIRQLRKAEETDQGTDEDIQVTEEESEAEEAEVEDLDEPAAVDDAEAETEQESDDVDDTTDDVSEESDKVSGLDLTEKRTFKANGEEFEFTVEEMLQQFGTIFGKSVDYTKKTKAIAPHRKRISAMEDENITDEQFNLMIDAFKGNKDAIKQIMDTHKIESYDLSNDGEQQNTYTPTEYGKDADTLNLQEIVNTMAQDSEYSITSDVVTNKWDESSQQKLASNPNLLQALHNDVKSGTYAKVAPEATKLKVLDGNTKSDIEYYMLAGQNINSSQGSANAEDPTKELNAKTQAEVDKSERASSEAAKKRAATNTSNRSDRTVIDYLDDDNDEAFDDWYKKTMASN